MRAFERVKGFSISLPQFLILIVSFFLIVVYRHKKQTERDIKDMQKKKEAEAEAELKKEVETKF